jgi:hypothetical protein
VHVPTPAQRHFAMSIEPSNNLSVARQRLLRFDIRFTSQAS